MNDYVKGISIVNPDEVEREYLLRCMRYAVKYGYNHVQITGPIHDGVKGNLDGMTPSRKYAQFNNEKDMDYVKLCMDVVNEALEITHAAGVKTYMWHHELDLPYAFGKAFPEVLNENGDIEVSHPLVKDYLEHKILDFFAAYPKMDGVILTLHETKVPLLKLKNQKLDKIARVKLVTKTLYDACKALGKELIVRPFASVAEDQQMMLKAYEEISPEMQVMDKWTKFDWSLSLPDNDFFKEITGNPFIVEGDIFGEYFGKGKLPIMFREHIVHKYHYCNQFPHHGFVLRIDRNYSHPFDSVNESNLIVMYALLNNKNVDEELDKFFAERYGKAAKAVREIMEKTEENQKKIFYLNGYYFTQGSNFPQVNHSKNHFWFEIMKENCQIASGEWFIPIGWQRGSIQDLLQEKEEAATEATQLFDAIKALQGQMDETEYQKLYVKFRNLDLVAKLWKELAYTFHSYTKYFETGDATYESKLKAHVQNIDAINAEGKAELGEAYYNFHGSCGHLENVQNTNTDFSSELLACFEAEKRAFAQMQQQTDLVDYILCGSAYEGHKLMKEVNFSDTLLLDGKQCRIPGNQAGMKWSQINAHGWFSYEVKTIKGKDNQIALTFKSATDTLSVQITIGDQVYTVKEKLDGEKTYTFTHKANADSVRIRIDRIDANTPLLYTVTVKA